MSRSADPFQFFRANDFYYLCRSDTDQTVNIKQMVAHKFLIKEAYKNIIYNIQICKTHERKWPIKNFVVKLKNISIEEIVLYNY